MINLFIDFSFLCHRALHSMGGLNHADIPTGVLYGFFESIRALAADPRIRSNQCHLFLDSKQSYRRQLFPAYKAKRHQDKSPEERRTAAALHQQMGLLAGALPGMGFPTYIQVGLESDDLLAKAAERGGVVITADSDLWQCISPGTAWFDPGRNVMYGPLSFREKKGIDPWHWRMVKALAGCHTDEVPGIPGVGEKTAIDFINHNLPAKGKKWAAIHSPAGAATVERNLALVSLPHPRTRAVDLWPITYNEAAFFAFAKEHGMASYLEAPRMNEWLAFFAGRFDTTHKRGALRG